MLPPVTTAETRHLSSQLMPPLASTPTESILNHPTFPADPVAEDSLLQVHTVS